MGKTITLDEQHFKAAAHKARQLGKTPARYIESLIDAAAISFDDILLPVRQRFKESGVTEGELDDAVAEARRTIVSQKKRKSRK